MEACLWTRVQVQVRVRVRVLAWTDCANQKTSFTEPSTRPIKTNFHWLSPSVAVVCYDELACVNE